jgi:hypothetical protein
MKFKFERKKSIVLNNNYVPINDPPQTIEEALSVFVGEVDNAVTRARIQFTLDRWNMIHGTDITMNDLNFN